MPANKTLFLTTNWPYNGVLIMVKCQKRKSDLMIMLITIQLSHIFIFQPPLDVMSARVSFNLSNSSQN